MKAWNGGNEDWRLNEMPSECRLALSVDRKDFFPYCCIVCRRSAVHCDSVILSRCGKCKRVHYCSRECQKKDFKKHKYLCQIMHDIPLQNEVKTLYEWGTYLKVHLQDMRVASQSFYGKDIWQSSFSLWMYQPHCQTCFVQDNLTVCEKCSCVARCNKPSCTEVFHTTHTEESCESHCIRLAAYVMAKQQSNYLKVASQSRNTLETSSSSVSSSPSPSSTQVSRLPGSWGGYWTEKLSDYEVPEMLLRLPPVMAMLTDSMSYIFTAMHCLQQLSTHSSKTTTTPSSTLCIHFIGADVLDVFGAQAGVFEEILHWFPAVTHLELVLIGPDMQADREGERRLINDGMCDSCSAQHCNIYLTCLKGLYHEAVEQGKLSTEFSPTIAMLCNSGLHEHSHGNNKSSLANMWAPTLSMLYDQKVPIAATSYTQEESRDDFAEMSSVLLATTSTGSSSQVSAEGLRGQLMIPPSRNPFRGLLPMPDTLSDNKFFYNNNYYFMLVNK
jgi:hypothetical protein